MKIQTFIEKAIEGGYNNGWGEGWVATAMDTGLAVESADISVFTLLERLLLDPKAWEAVGKVEGWGQYDKKFEDIEHDWELDSYKADTAKTPIYYCKVCGAKKESNIVSFQLSEDYHHTDIDNNSPEFEKKEILREHATFKKRWTYMMNGLTPHLIAGNDIESYIKTL